jgi:DNA-binding NarL/FixJ family response regulator
MEGITESHSIKESNPSPARLMLVDDHPVLIDGMKALLKKERCLQVVGEAHDGRQALDMMDKLNPDLVLTDISMPHLDGLELTRIIKSTHPEVKVLVLTMYANPSVIRAVLAAEAEGYMLKNAGKEELLRAIRRILNQGTYYASTVLDVLLKGLEQEMPVNSTTPSVKEVLTPREIEILNLIVAELTTAEIAERLFISAYTVDTHRKRILEKTHARTIVGLIKYALSQGLTGSFSGN